MTKDTNTTSNGEKRGSENISDDSTAEQETTMEKIQNILFKWVFPIYKYELLQVIPLIVMMFSSLFSYTAYRDIKDPIVFSEERQTLHTVQWCKVMVMFISVPIASLYFKLANVISREMIFYQTVFLFAAYFIINATLLYPGRAAIHQTGVNVIRRIAENEAKDSATIATPLTGLFVFPLNTIHYVASELWGTISVSFLLWGYINDITPKDKAKRYYGTLGLGAQLGPILGGRCVDYLKNKCGKGPAAFLKMNVYLNFVSIIFMAMFAGGYALLTQYVMKLPRFAKQIALTTEKKGDKPKMSVLQAFKYCFTNPYVLALGGMVFAYGWVMVVSEMTYKDIMKLYTDGDQAAYSAFKGKESFWSAIGAVFMMIFVSHNVIRIFGWKVTALLAPVACSILAGILYFIAIIFDMFEEDDNHKGDVTFFTKSKYSVYAVYSGIILCIMVKAIKYASFDPAKELAYLVLTKEQKYKAKAAVDIVGARAGKGGAALLVNIVLLNMILTSEVTYVKKCIYASAVSVAFGLLVWFASDIYIAKTMKILAKKKADAEAQAKTLSEIQVDGQTTTTDVLETNSMQEIDVEIDPTKKDAIHKDSNVEMENTQV